MPLFNLREDTTPHPHRWWHIPLLLLLIVGTILIAREYNAASNPTGQTAWKSSETQKNEGSVFGTIYHLTVAPPTVKATSTACSQTSTIASHPSTPTAS